MSREAEIKQALRDWIVKKNGKIDASVLTDEIGIIEQRIITSLQIMDLIMYLEKLTGEPLDVEQLKPGVFKNIDTIYQNFCQESSNADKA